MRIEQVEFVRKKNLPAETGIMIGGDKLIIDRLGNVVPSPVWDYYLQAPIFCVTLFDKE